MWEHGSTMIKDKQGKEDEERWQRGELSCYFRLVCECRGEGCGATKEENKETW